MAKNNKILVSMSEIVAYTGRPGNTIKQWVKKYNFPAVKINGRWESNTDLIDNFQRRRIEDMIGGSTDGGVRT
jgi:hypothetical protein